MAFIVLRGDGEEEREKKRERERLQEYSYNIPKENIVSCKELFFKYFDPFGKQFIYNAYFLNGLIV